MAEANGKGEAPSMDHSAAAMSSSSLEENLSAQKPGGKLTEWDVVVVGAGIMGSCSAWELARRCAKVLLLEQYDFLHRRGSSHGESRITRRTYPQDYYTAMMIKAYELWDAAQAEAGFQVFTKTGGLDFGYWDQPAIKDLIDSAAKYKVPHVVLTPAQVKERFPQFNIPDDLAVIYCPDSGVLNATKAVAMFQQLAKQRGATLKDRTEVLNILAGPLLDGSQGIHVVTKEGTIKARQCVVAAGAWSGKLLKSVAGIELPIQPKHITVAYWRCKNPEVFAAANGCPLFIVYQGFWVYGTPVLEYPGMMKVAYHDGPLCDPDERSLAPVLEPPVQGAAPWLKTLFGDQVEADKPAYAEACMYSMTPDEDFILDRVLLKEGDKLSQVSVVVAAGFSGHGFKMGPLIGKIMADLALHGQCTEAPMEKFSAQRFLKH